MIQIKQFDLNVDINVVNKFLELNANCNILSFNPWIIQYEIIDNEERPVIELFGPPIDIEFWTYLIINRIYPENNKTIWESYKATINRVLIFNDYIILSGNKNVFKINIKSRKIYKNKRRLLSEIEFDKCTYSTDGIDSYYLNGRNFDIKSDSFILDLIENLRKFNIVTSSISHNYNNRTNSLIETGNKIAVAGDQISGGLCSIAGSISSQKTTISGDWTDNDDIAAAGKTQTGNGG